MNVCKHCNEIYSNRKTDHYRMCSEYKIFIAKCNDICTKEFLEQEYLTKMKSLITISKELGLEKTRLVLAKIIEYNIPQRSIQEATANPTRQALTRKKSREKYGVDHHLMNRKVIQKRKDGLMEKYGVEYISQIDFVKYKSKQTCLKKYGVQYAIQSSIVKDKIATTNIEKYGVDNPWKNKEVNRKCINTKFNNDSLAMYFSKSSQQLFWKLYNNLPKELQEKCYFAELNKEFTKYKGKPYMLDFVISSINYCLEYNGNYYHANPKLYESDWVNTKINMTAQEIWDRDVSKHQIIKDFGFHLDLVWEDEDIEEAVTRLTASIVSIQKTHKGIVDEIDPH